MATLAIDQPYIAPAAPAKSKLQQAIHESTAALVAQLQAGKSEALTAYLTTMARFHTYSFGNQLAIAKQKPTATQVAGFHKWLELHRYVKKGEKGIAILAPMILKRDKQNTDGTSESGPRLIGFKVVYVFDLAQTDGEPLPDFEIAPHGEPGELVERLKAHIEASGTPVTYDPGIAPARGLCFPSWIKLLPDMSPAEQFSTLAPRIRPCPLTSGRAADTDHPNHTRDGSGGRFPLSSRRLAGWSVARLQPITFRCTTATPKPLSNPCSTYRARLARF